LVIIRGCKNMSYLCRLEGHSVRGDYVRGDYVQGDFVRFPMNLPGG